MGGRYPPGDRLGLREGPRLGGGRVAGIVNYPIPEEKAMQVPARVDAEVRSLAASQAGDLSSHACQLDDGFAAIVVTAPR